MNTNLKRLYTTEKDKDFKELKELDVAIGCFDNYTPIIEWRNTEKQLLEMIDFENVKFI